MSETELDHLRAFSAASPAELKFAASEALKEKGPEAFFKHGDRRPGDPDYFTPSVKSVGRLDQDNAIISFFPRYRLWGERLPPVTLPITLIAMKLEVISLAKSAMTRNK